MGSGLVVVLVDDASSDPTTPTIAVTDELGNRIASAPLEGIPTSQMMPQIAFDSATRQALVAISMPDESTPFALRVARFSCQ